MARRVRIKAMMAGLVLAIMVSSSVSAQGADPSVLANLVLQVQELQDEVRTLRGLLDEQDGPDVVAAIDGDTQLTHSQKQALKEIYLSFASSDQEES